MSGAVASAWLAAGAGVLAFCALVVVVRLSRRLRERGSELASVRAELSTARAEFRLAAITDALTGLYNRRFFDEVTRHHLEHHRRFQLELSLLYIDVDRFKVINDAHGHALGDRVLRHVATYLRHTFREADYVFRIGGDEFIVLISCGAAQAALRVGDLQRGFYQTLLEEDLPTSLGLSVGIAQVEADARDLEHAIALADERMYEDKRRRAAASVGE